MAKQYGNSKTIFCAFHATFLPKLGVFWLWCNAIWVGWAPIFGGGIEGGWLKEWAKPYANQGLNKVGPP